MYECIARYMNSPYIFVQLGSKLNNENDVKHHHFHPPPTKYCECEGSSKHAKRIFIIFIFFLKTISIRGGECAIRQINLVRPKSSWWGGGGWLPTHYQVKLQLMLRLSWSVTSRPPPQKIWLESLYVCD
jgi:hypothetical protein